MGPHLFEQKDCKWRGWIGEGRTEDLSLPRDLKNLVKEETLVVGFPWERAADVHGVRRRHLTCNLDHFHFDMNRLVS